MAKLITTTNDGSRVIDYGSEAGYWRIVTDLAGAGTDGWAEMPKRENFELVFGQSENKKVSEGRISYTSSTSYDPSLKIVTLQSGAIESFDFADIVENKIIEALIETNDIPIPGEGHTYAHMLLKLTKRPDVKAKASQEYMFRIYRPTATITLALTNLLFPNFKATFVTSSLVHTLNTLVGKLSVV